MKRKKTFFEESLVMNNYTYIQYYNRLLELSLSMFNWVGLPDTVDVRYLELGLFQDGQMVYFNDEVVGDLCLNTTINGVFDVYGYPLKRRAYSKYNNYQKELTNKNSVIIWNNYIHTNSMLDITMFAKRLYNLDRIIDINSNAQKTPVLLQGNEKEKMTMINMYKEYDGNAPVIFGYDNLNKDMLSVLKTDAPYVADKIFELKTQIWNEALTYLGISNVTIQKKERMVTDEVQRNQGGTIASRYSRLESRRQGAEKINKMFGTNIEVNYREDINTDMSTGTKPDLDSNLGGDDDE